MITDRLDGRKDTSSMECEQRKYKRRLVKNNIFAALRGGFKKVGKIKDISIEGLGFSYLRQTGDTRSDDRDSQVDIFLPENGFHLFNIPCRIVYEKTDVDSVEGFPVEMSRCGLYFGKLSEIQLDLLDFIITKHTVKKMTKEKISVTLNNFI
jgi:hypothetical protein